VLGRGLLLPLAAVGAFVAADAWRLFEQGFLNGERRQRDYTLRAGLDAWARPLAGAALAAALVPAALPVITGFAAGSAAVSLLLRGRVVRGEGSGERGAGEGWMLERRGAFLRYALPLIPLAAMNWVMSLGDRYLLAAFWSTGAAGVYAAAYGLGSQPFIAVR